MSYNREESLQKSFNNFWRGRLGINDAYQKLSIEDLVALKNAVSDINNIITLRVSIKFIDMLREQGVLSYGSYIKAVELVNGESPNANGYDIKLEEQKIVAEVKCNIPIKDKTFGANQIKGIRKDIDGMNEPLKKTKDKTDTKDYLKFMVLLDNDGVREAMKKIINSYNGGVIFKEFPLDCCDQRDNTIYVCYIKA